MPVSWCIVLMIPIIISLSIQTVPEKQVSAFINGNFTIGALFPVHYPPQSKKGSMKNLGIRCGEIREHYGIQRVEATFQTLDKINSDPNLLPNLTLGVEIRDECWYAPVALQQSIEFIRDAITPSNLDTCRSEVNVNRSASRGPLIGVVGPGSSSVALQVQNLLQLFHLPQIGYSTTSRDLSDKSRFNYFLRVVPSDYYQAQVMLDIVRYFGWTYVSAVNTDENYGQSGIQAFKELAEKDDVCIAREDSVLSSAPDEDFDKVVKNIRQDANANVVVCFCEGRTVSGLLRSTRRLNLTNHFLFIGSDGWGDRGDVTESYEQEAWGGLSIRIHSPRVSSFDHYYWSLRPSNNHRNPWFREFWQKKFACRLSLMNERVTKEVAENNTLMDGNRTLRTEEASGELCTENESLATNYTQDSKLSFVIRAIYTMAYALHNMQQDICGHGVSGICSKLLPFNGSLFKNYLFNVSFEYEKELISFDENGDPPGRYDIMNFQRLANGSFDYVQVGGWNNHTLTLNESAMQFGPDGRTVKSVCSEDCPMGKYKSVQQGGKDKRCCWVCASCPDGQIFQDGACMKCPLGFAPDKWKTECFRLPTEYVQWHDTQAIVAIIFASLGFLSALFTSIVFVKYNNTPIVKSSTRELCYIILAGTTVSHGSIFVILAKPSTVTCALTRFLPGLSFAMIYSALLTKTNRIARILAGSKDGFPTRKPMLMSATAQVLITLFLISIEILISGFMQHYQPPNEDYVYLNHKTLLQCNTTPENILVPLSFDFFLILLCTIYAVKTRNVPENFNEAKFIGFSMYTTCVIWIAFVPIYFGSNSKVITMCMCVTLSATVTWIFLFIPKLYIIIFQPEKNNRAYFTTTKIRCHIGSRVGSAITDKSCSNSWRESTTSIRESEKCIKDFMPQKRSLSCQTGTELLQVILNPRALLEVCSSPRDVYHVPRIIEKNCCDSDNCQLKNITIKLPDRPLSNIHCKYTT